MGKRLKLMSWELSSGRKCRWRREVKEGRDQGLLLHVSRHDLAGELFQGKPGERESNYGRDSRGIAGKKKEGAMNREGARGAGGI